MNVSSEVRCYRLVPDTPRWRKGGPKGLAHTKINEIPEKGRSLVDTPENYIVVAYIYAIYTSTLYLPLKPYASTVHENPTRLTRPSLAGYTRVYT